MARHWRVVCKSVGLIEWIDGHGGSDGSGRGGDGGGAARCQRRRAAASHQPVPCMDARGALEAVG
jgi:hypothetical protein